MDYSSGLTLEYKIDSDGLFLVLSKGLRLGKKEPKWGRSWAFLVILLFLMIILLITSSAYSSKQKIDGVRAWVS